MRGLEPGPYPLTVKTNLVSRQSSWFAGKGYAEQVRALPEDIRCGRAPGVTDEDGARATTLCLKMLGSARIMSLCELDWKSELVVPLPEPASSASQSSTLSSPGR